MKAENILNANLRRKSTIVYKFFRKNWIFKNFSLYFDKKKFFRMQIFQNFFNTTPKVIFSVVCKHQK